MSPPCPACGRRMRKRVNSATREAFWGCSDYPRCKGTLPWDGRDDPQASVFAGFGPAPERVMRDLERLRARLGTLEAECQRLRALAPVVPWPQEELVRELTRLIGACHPDKWGGESRVATALTQELLALRQRLGASR